MNLRTLVWRELFERKSQLLTCLLAILLGITALVAIKNVTYFSEKAVAREMDSLGANVLVLPKSVTLQDYYSADLHGDVLPEEYVLRLTMSDIQGVDNLSPKLNVPIELEGRKYSFTGILPKSEFQAKAAWAGAGVFSRPIGCGAIKGVTDVLPEDQRAIVRNRVIKDLGDHEVLIGADVSKLKETAKGDSLTLLGEAFNVVAVLPETGTIDDSRIFGHLHTVQRLSGKGEVVNCIEIVGCCKEISAGLVENVNQLLPNAKVVTVKQVVATQQNVNHMMERLSGIFLIIMIVVGGAAIANYMYSNVFQRRREIGTLMALGAESGVVLQIFLLKGFLLGFVGGVGGFVIGTILAITLGPKLAGVAVFPMPILALWAVGISLAITLVASYFPARSAVRLDPVATFQEV